MDDDGPGSARDAADAIQQQTLLRQLTDQDAATKAFEAESVETRRAIDRKRIEPPSTAFPSCKAAESTSATAAEVKVDVSRHSGNV